MQLSFGREKKIDFENESEFFETLGLLASQRHTKIKMEQNDLNGAWGREGRIQCYTNIDSFPVALSRRFSSGVGSIQHRVNCNEFVVYLIQEYGFTQERRNPNGVIDISPPEIDILKSSIPDQYLDAFESGYNI